jgi:flavin-dependent thymidylate synthase
MASIEIRDDFTVELVEVAGSDEMITRAARVSTLNDMGFHTPDKDKLIGFLMKNRHGSPFEHGMITFRIEAPIFVWREFMRHRVGVSYNEQSGRYTEMKNEFYIPNKERNLVQVGRPGSYTFVPGDSEQFHGMDSRLYSVAQHAWTMYLEMLKEGIAKEVARMCLPVNIYSAAYVTMNPRSLMHFLSLRTLHLDSKFPSFPQWEINQVADQMEAIFRGLFPFTYDAFHTNGRVCP